jgi:hypothetical protein
MMILNYRQAQGSLNCAAANALACDQARFNSSEILLKTMKKKD